jgi:hypothetical protein
LEADVKFGCFDILDVSKIWSLGEAIGILLTSVTFDTGGVSNGFHIYAAIDKQATIRMMK